MVKELLMAKDHLVNHRFILDGGNLFAWNSGIGPVLQIDKIIKIALQIPLFHKAFHWSLKFNRIKKVRGQMHSDLTHNVRSLNLMNLHEINCRFSFSLFAPSPSSIILCQTVLEASLLFICWDTIHINESPH